MNRNRSKYPSDEILKIPQGKPIRFFLFDHLFSKSLKALLADALIAEHTFLPDSETWIKNHSILSIHFEIRWIRNPHPSWPSKVKDSAKSRVWIKIFHNFTRNELHNLFIIDITYQSCLLEQRFCYHDWKTKILWNLSRCY